MWAVLVAQAARLVAPLDVRQPALVTLGDLEVVARRDRRRRAVVLAEPAVHAVVLHAEQVGRVGHERQVGEHEAGPESGAELAVDHAAVLAHLAQAGGDHRRDRLHGHRAVVVGNSGIAEVANVLAERGRDLGAADVDVDGFHLDRERAAEDVLILLLDQEADDVFVRKRVALVDHGRRQRGDADVVGAERAGLRLDALGHRRGVVDRRGVGIGRTGAVRRELLPPLERIAPRLLGQIAALAAEQRHLVEAAVLQHAHQHRVDHRIAELGDALHRQRSRDGSRSHAKR